MSISLSDLVWYNAANMPDDDVSVAGGAIDPLRRADFTQIVANDTIEAVSSSAGDTMNITVEARDAGGNVVAETKALTGTTPISFSVLGTVERILKVELASAPAGAITVRRTTGPTTIRIIPAGERGFAMFTRKAQSDPSVTKDYYSKVFLKNTHVSLSLQQATFKQNADPDNRVTHLPANVADDTATTANRVTAPSAANTLDPDVFDDTSKLAGSIGPGSAWGCWLRTEIPAGDAPHRTTYTLEATGASV